ncbi:hypothetical protein [Cytobacillus oceanisediminis]|uniref:hypothetical protein n=1 Tax=Cytobacillus oceanisediminis TaxID=665099 RepID=UPI00373527F3
MKTGYDSGVDVNQPAGLKSDNDATPILVDGYSLKIYAKSNPINAKTRPNTAKAFSPAYTPFSILKNSINQPKKFTFLRLKSPPAGKYLIELPT